VRQLAFRIGDHSPPALRHDKLDQIADIAYESQGQFFVGPGDTVVLLLEVTVEFANGQSTLDQVVEFHVLQPSLQK